MLEDMLKIAGESCVCKCRRQIVYICCVCIHMFDYFLQVTLAQTCFQMSLIKITPLAAAMLCTRYALLGAVGFCCCLFLLFASMLIPNFVLFFAVPTPSMFQKSSSVT